jgi:hypothetical protein
MHASMSSVSRRSESGVSILVVSAGGATGHLLSHALSASAFGAAVSSHWGIENQVHWVLDMTFVEDRSRVRVRHAAENLAVLRHLALNLMRRVSNKRVSLKARRLAAGWEPDYLLQIPQAP